MSLYGFGDAFSKLETFVRNFEPSRFKVRKLVFLNPKSSKPGQTWCFMCQRPFSDWLKLETHPSSLLTSDMANNARQYIRVEEICLGFHYCLLFTNKYQNNNT